MTQEKLSIPDVFAKWCISQPDTDIAADSDATITYTELDKASDKFAAGLLARGINASDRVCVLAPPGINFLVSFLGTVKVGAIWVGLNPKYTSREIEHVLTDTSAAIVFVQNGIRGRDYWDVFKQYVDQIPLVSFTNEASEVFDRYCEFEASPPTDWPQSVSPDLPACIIYTSGTTGAPKGALISHHALTKTSAVQHEILAQEYPRILNNLPINHIGCLGDLTMYAITGGGFIAFQEQFDAENCLQLIEEHKLNLWAQIPTMFQLSLEALKRRSYDLSSIECILFSGAPASPALIEDLKAICPKIGNAYGMTETVGSVTWTVGSSTEILTSTIGYPAEAYDIRIASPEGQAIPKGEVGEIQVRGDFHMMEYWQNPTATNDTFTTDGWLKTGDLAAENKDGSYRLTGRIKEMFKSGGYNVYPLEVEQILESMPELQKAIVVPVPDSLFNEVGFAFFQSVENSQPTSTDLKSHCLENMANYKVPKYFQEISDLPYLPNGKVDKNELKNIAASYANEAKRS